MTALLVLSNGRNAHLTKRTLGLFLRRRVYFACDFVRLPWLNWLDKSE